MQVSTLSSIQVGPNPTSTPGANEALPAYEQDQCSVDSLYQLIGQPRNPIKVSLTPQRAAQVRELTNRQLAEAAAAEAATVGAWQLLPHQRLKAEAAQPTSLSHPVTCTAARDTMHKDEGCCLQNPALEVAIGQATCGSDVAPQRIQRPGVRMACIATDTGDTQGRHQGRVDAPATHTVKECNSSSVQQYLGAAPAAEAVTRHQQSCSPLIHHTAIMRAAAVKANVAKLSAAS